MKLGLFQMTPPTISLFDIENTQDLNDIVEIIRQVKAQVPGFPENLDEIQFNDTQAYVSGLYNRTGRDVVLFSIGDIYFESPHGSFFTNVREVLEGDFSDVDPMHFRPVPIDVTEKYIG